MYTTLLAFRKVVHTAFMNTYITKTQTYFATVAMPVGQLKRSQVDNHRKSIKISYGRPLPQRVLVRSMIKPAIRSVKASTTLLTANTAPTMTGSRPSASVQ